MKVFIPYLYIGTEELRYTLRGIEKFVANDGIVICGSNFPEWLTNVEIIYYQDNHDPKEKGNNSHGKLLHCLPYLGEDFICYMDDIYLTREWTFENYKYKKLSKIGKSKTWLKTIRNTIDLIGDAESFETHCPIVYNSSKIKELNLPEKDYGYCVKTIYCNRYHIPGIESEDLKINTAYNTIDKLIKLVGDSLFFTTGELAWNHIMVDFMNSLYPNKSNFEKSCLQ